MLLVWSSKKCMLEKEYVWRVLLKEFLGVEYHLTYDDSVIGYQIQLENNALITFEDDFFGRYSEDDYAHADHVPATVDSLRHELFDQLVPVIYGSARLEVEDRQIACGLDIVGSTFFMLTRWEEHVVRQRDEHDRFPLRASLAYRAGFHQRPVVNQYVELLWNMLTHLNAALTRKKRRFRVIPTHDVDRMRRWRGWGQTLRVPYRNVVVERNPARGLHNLRNMLQVKLGLKDDPYDTFDYLMRASEKFSLQSRFYFMAGGETAFDNYYQLGQLKVQDLLETIKSRGHQIGFHPSYNSYTRPLLWRQERDALAALAPRKITKGRQHYLRFEVPTTWQIWEDAGMSVDSSLGYPEAPGFRCGTCYAFPVFNFLTRYTMSLYESPLICSEASLIEHQHLSPRAAEEEVRRVYEETQRYQGNFVLLWHNAALFTEEHTPYRRLYEMILRGF